MLELWWKQIRTHTLSLQSLQIKYWLKLIYYDCMHNKCERATAIRRFDIHVVCWHKCKCYNIAFIVLPVRFYIKLVFMQNIYLQVHLSENNDVLVNSQYVPMKMVTK